MVLAKTLPSMALEAAVPTMSLPNAPYTSAVAPLPTCAK